MERTTDGSSPDLVGLHDSQKEDEQPSTSHDQVAIEIEDAATTPEQFSNTYPETISQEPVLSHENVHAYQNPPPKPFTPSSLTPVRPGSSAVTDVDTEPLFDDSIDSETPYVYYKELDDSLSPAEKSQLQLDYTRMLDDMSGKPASIPVTPLNLEPESFKEGFFTSTETPRHFVDVHDMSDHHRTGDFPHLRHLMSPGTHSSKSLDSDEKRRGKHGHHHRGRKRSHKKHRHDKQKRKKTEAGTSDAKDKELIQISEENIFSDELDGGSSDSSVEGLSPVRSPSEEEKAVKKTPSGSVPVPEIQIDVDGDEFHTPPVGFFIGDDAPSPEPSRKPSMLTAPHGKRPLSGDRRVSFSVAMEPVGSGGSLDKQRKSSVPDEKEPPKFSFGGEEERLKYSKTMPGEITSTSSFKKSHRHTKVPSQVELEARKMRGSEVELSQKKRPLTQFTLTNEKYSQLDLDDMASHRFFDSVGLQRRRRSHSAATSVIQVAPPSAKPEKSPKPPLDHNPHELFVELDELFTGEDNQYQWKEKARWIKYEEDVEEGANKWGKPHVSSLSFHSLLDLRKCIETGVILLDLQQDNLPAIASCITEELVKSKQLAPENRGKVLKVLLLKHKHMDERGFIRRNSTFFQLSSARDQRGYYRPLSMPANRRQSIFKKTPTIQRNASFPSSHLTPDANGNMQGIAAESIDGIYKKQPDDSTLPEVSIKMPPVFSPLTPVTEKDEEKMQKEGTDYVSGVTATPPPIPRNKSMTDASSILKRIPDGAETTSVLVGCVDYLDKPIMAFVRLAEGCELENLTEVPLPVRFLFLLMGPANSRFDYHEIGRSISTLMSNTSFHDVAYMAEDRTDLLKALNTFLDESIVLPPGEIDKKTLLPIIDMAKERARERKKKKREKEAKQRVAIDEPPPPPPFDPLKRTGRPFGGVINDIKKRYPLYWSDIKDGLNTQCLATFFFVYFACLSPAITFGGLLSEKTEQWLGVTEMLVGTFACGTVFALVAGQPLLIMGGTGPVLVFEVGLYEFCTSMELDFLSFRCWVGFWVTIVVLLFIGLEGVWLVRYFTRFTEEIFASLISLIFIIEVFIKINKQFELHPLQEYYSPVPGCIPEDVNNNVTNLFHTTMDYITGISDSVTDTVLQGTTNSNNTVNNTDYLSGNDTPTSEPPFSDHLCYVNKPNTALLSVILTFGTFFIAYFLKQFRNSKFLGRNARRALGDFGIPIAIVAMLVVDILIGDTAYTEKLNVPDGMIPTDSTKRGWFVNPMGVTKSLPVWACFAGAIPALLLFILLFMETIITSVIVNKPERKMQKGTGYHLDMQLIGLFASVCGILGTPFLTVATVRSVTHVSALVVYSKSHAPGERPKIMEVKEQRVTAFLVHIMLGLSTLLGPVLRHIPLAVLFGVFLYMGVASINGIQLFDRVSLLFMPIKHHPVVGYVRKVRLLKMHLFTVIQLICLAVLWAVKSTAAALAFPFVLILMVPFRLIGLKYIFSKEELQHLDNHGEAEEDEGHDSDDEPDFYEQAHMPF